MCVFMNSLHEHGSSCVYSNLFFVAACKWCQCHPPQGTVDPACFSAQDAAALPGYCDCVKSVPKEAIAPAAPLPPLNIDPHSITISGISSGAGCYTVSLLTCN